jgi:hypothetical protein
MIALLFLEEEVSAKRTELVGFVEPPPHPAMSSAPPIV